MRSSDRQIQRQLTKAKDDYDNLVTRQRAAYDMPDVALPKLEYKDDLRTKLEHYTTAPQPSPDLHVFDRYFREKATELVSVWEERDRAQHDRKVLELGVVKQAADGLVGRLGYLSGKLEKDWDRAESTVTKANLVLTKATRSLHPGAATESDVAVVTAPPAGGRLHEEQSNVRTVVLWSLLMVAAVVDVITFYPLAALVLDKVLDWQVWTAAGGFTAVALLLAHLAGRWMSDRRVVDRRNVLTSWTADLAIAGWMLMGGIALWVRLTKSEGSSSGSTIIVDGVPVETSSATSPGPHSALLFLAVYVLSGLVAFLAAYHDHNHFARARRQAQRTLDRLGPLSPQARDLRVAAAQLADDIDRHVKDIEVRWGNSKEERIDIVSKPAIEDAHIALRGVYPFLRSEPPVQPEQES